MPETDWRTRAGTTFRCEKQPATGTRGMVVTNHPLASAAGAEMLAAGGNAIDAAIAALFTLTVVEPMMVGILGGGMAHIRLADGRHVVIDNQSMAPLATGPTTYTPDPNAAPGTMDTIGRKNAVGPTAVASPGNLKGWCEAVGPLRHLPAGRCDGAGDPPCLARLPRHALPARMRLGLRRRHGARSGDREALSCPAEHRSLPARGWSPATMPRRCAASRGKVLICCTPARSARLYADHMARSGGYITRDDLTRYRTVERDALRGTYRGFEIVGPPPPSSGPLHIIQMLNILEGYDIGALGFGSADTLHLLAEVLKIAFADRAAATADPAFVKVPVEKLLSKSYAADAPRAHRSRARAELERRGGARRRRAHHASDRGRRHGQHRRQHADDQLAVRRTLHRAGHRHDPEQLHVRVHAASGPRQFGGARQAGHLVDVAGDACCATASRAMRWACPAGCASSPR